MLKLTRKVSLYGEASHEDAIGELVSFIMAVVKVRTKTLHELDCWHIMAAFEVKFFEKTQVWPYGRQTFGDDEKVALAHRVRRGAFWFELYEFPAALVSDFGLCSSVEFTRG